MQTNDRGPTKVSFFTKEPESVYVDNFANTHILNKKDHFVEFNPIQRSSRDKVSTVGGFATPSGEGTMRWSWRNNNGRSHAHLLKNCHYYPDSPACIFSPSQFGIQLNNINGGTGINSVVKTSTFSWNKKQFVFTIQHTPSFMPKMDINDSTAMVASYFSSFETFFDGFLHFTFLTDDEFKNTFASNKNHLSTLGCRVVYRKDGKCFKGMIVLISLNQLFKIRLNDGSEISTTHDFIQFEDSSILDSGVLPEPVLEELQQRIQEDPSSCPKIKAKLSSEQQ